MPGHGGAESPLMQQGAAVYGSPQSCCLPQRAFLPAQVRLGMPTSAGTYGMYVCIARFQIDSQVCTG